MCSNPVDIYLIKWFSSLSNYFNMCLNAVLGTVRYIYNYGLNPKTKNTQYWYFEKYYTEINTA